MTREELIEEGKKIKKGTGGRTSDSYRIRVSTWETQCTFLLDYVKASREVRNRLIIAFANFKTRYSDGARIDEIIGILQGLPIEEIPLAKVKKEKEKKFSDKVFIVHGHNRQLRTEVKNVLLELGLKPVVLSEQANGGKTIIEKFEEKSACVNYAIILMTADDEGKAKKDHDYKPRSRQNVILEMGYFMACLKRSNVFLLLEDDVEMPSDINGIVYASIHDNWKQKLVQELRNCGYKVSADDLSVE